MFFGSQKNSNSRKKTLTNIPPIYESLSSFDINILILMQHLYAGGSTITTVKHMNTDLNIFTQSNRFAKSAK